MELLLPKNDIERHIKDIISEAEDLSELESLYKWGQRTKDYLLNSIRENEFADNFWSDSKADYSPMGFFSKNFTVSKYAFDKQRAMKFLKLFISDLEKVEATLPDNMPINNLQNNRVFIVHGHDEAVKQKVARTLEQLGLEPIILSDQPNGGKTIIEKFEKESKAGFAVVLMTADDQGGSNSDVSVGNLTPRARQNVLLELGYFFGKLGRECVCVLKEQNVEVPTDILGIVYEEIDANDSWKIKLVKELKAAGYDVSADNII